MNLPQRYLDNIKQQKLFTVKDKLLVAVSGGVDSVVLCELCKQTGFHFTIVHCNFKLRGEESNRDEQFVRDLGKKYGVEVFVKTFDTDMYAAENKLSTQEAARELRYNWFAELVKAHQSLLTTYLLTAHHADDNNETVLMNFFRGTGLHGLTGIPENAGYLRRPLLNFSKKELIEFAKENQLQFVEDSSNQSSKYTRNFFRNEILPTISKVYPQVSENLQDNIKRFKEIEQLYHFTVNELKKKICKQKANDTWIAVKELMNYKNNALIYEIIAAFDFTEKQIEEVIKLAESESGRYIQSPGGKYRMIKHRNWFIVSSVSTIQSENIIIEKEVESIAFAGGKLQITSLNNKPLESNSKIACLDAKGIEFPLLLRKWKAGDYFYPLGMAKKKKLSRFFIDQKLSKIEKENSWVIESKSRVIWIVGQRIDNRFKVTEKTANVLQFTLSA